MTEQNQPLEHRPAKYFTKIGDRTVATRSYSVNAFLEHLKDKHGPKSRKQWCDRDCAFKAFSSERCTDEKRKKMGERFGRAYTELLYRGVLLLKDQRKDQRRVPARKKSAQPLLGVTRIVGSHKKILAVKLFNDALAADRNMAHEQYEDARRRKDANEAKMIQVITVMGRNFDFPNESI